MPDENLTPGEIAILMILMVEARQLTNNELKAITGSATIAGRTRTKFLALDLVTSTKTGNMYAHTITKGGRDRCRREIAAGRPKTAKGVAYGALYSVLANVTRFADREEVPLEYVFEGVGDLPTVAEPAVEPSPGQPLSAEPLSPAVDLETQVRDAYKQLASKPGGWVNLAELRPLLGDATQTDVDDVLKRMARLPDVSLIPEENQKSLNADQRNAAVKIGGKFNHFIAIEIA